MMKKEKWTVLGVDAGRSPRLAFVALILCSCATIEINDPQEGEESEAEDDVLEGAGGENMTLTASGGTTPIGPLIGSGGISTGGSSNEETSSGGTATGGDTSTGGTVQLPEETGSGLTIDDCTPLGLNETSGSFGTTDAVCFTAEEPPPSTWAVYNGEGRTIWINEVAMSPGTLPWPGSAPYMIDFSEGDYDYASWSYY